MMSLYTQLAFRDILEQILKKQLPYDQSQHRILAYICIASSKHTSSFHMESNPVRRSVEQVNKNNVLTTNILLHESIITVPKWNPDCNLVCEVPLR
ncbi:hypothetical protein Hanom_Chr13g01231931 [Helianthus anomalus]